MILLTALMALAQPIQVYKSPNCGCCGKWITHLEASKFKVTATDMPDVGPKKDKLKIPRDQWSCHTGVVEGYFVEGHVPAADIYRLLKEKPKDVLGLSVPEMPVGTPGMEMGDKRDPFKVFAVLKNGKTRVWKDYPKGFR